MKDKNGEQLNNKGFTLVELLATISILAIIMLIAIPNIVGVVQRSRNKTYVEDAKKMVALAKYKVKSDVSVKNTLGNSSSVCLYLSYLDTGKEIKDAPNGGEYSTEFSYVYVKKQSDGTYSYSVQLLEEKDSNIRGLPSIESEELAKDNSFKNVENTVTSPNVCNGAYEYK